MYPGIIVPYLPKKIKNYDSEFIESERTSLQQFISDILDHPLLRRSKLVIDFLSMSEGDWNESIKNFKKSKTPNEVAKIRTIEGKANVEITEDVENYCNGISALLNTFRNDYISLKNVNEKIAGIYHDLSQSIIEAGHLYEKIGIHYSKLEAINQTNIFLIMGDIHNKVGNIYKDMRNIFERKLPILYTYLKDELNSVEELCNAKKHSKQTMILLETDLKSTKEYLYEKKEYSKWKIENNPDINIDEILNNKEKALAEMLPQETKEAEDARFFYGYYANKLSEEFKRILQKDYLIIKDYFGNAPSLLIFSEVELQKAWAELFKRIDTINKRP